MADKKLLAIQKLYEAKIQQLQEQIKILQEKRQNDIADELGYQTRAIYGGLCLALHDIGVSKEGIISMMQSTEEYWNDSLENDWDIVDAVRETVGINIINVVEGGSNES